MNDHPMNASLSCVEHAEHGDAAPYPVRRRLWCWRIDIEAVVRGVSRRAKCTRAQRCFVHGAAKHILGTVLGLWARLEPDGWHLSEEYSGHALLNHLGVPRE